MSSIDFAYLADRERAIPLVAKWYFEQWGHLIEDETLDRATDRMHDYLNRAEIPFILLALDHEEIVGAAQLKYYEMRQTFPDRKHWLGGVYVAPGRRGAGLGSRLAEEIASRASVCGVETLYLQTEQLDGGLYARLGWLPLEQVDNHGLKVLVMERRL